MSKISGLFKKLFSKRGLFFFLATLLFLAVSAVQLYAGNFLLQESGQLDSITAYDYALPAINSGAVLITLASFLLAGFFAYDKNKVKMFRFPMAYSISAAVGSFLSNFFTAIHSTPMFNSDIDLTRINAWLIMAMRLVVMWCVFLYFDDGDGDYCGDYYTYDPYGQPGGTNLREKILTHRFSTLWVVLIVSEGTGLLNKLLTTGLASLIIFVPEEYYWLSYYIYVVTDLVYCLLLILLSMYLVRSFRVASKLCGIIVLSGSFMECFSFVFNSITNVFAQAGDHLLNSIFSTVFVSIASVLIGVIRFAVLFLLCRALRKATEEY